MTMWPDDRDRIDIAIDGIAREMVGPAPRAGFTARVLTRISAPRSARRAGRVVSPVALAALVVVGVAVYGIRELTSPRLVQPPVPERHAGSPARSSRGEVKPE